MSNQVYTYDFRQCNLGEGSLWHPMRKQLFWFDINNKQLQSQTMGIPLTWQFDQYVSAAGWIDYNRLLIASESMLFTFDLKNNKKFKICFLEADNKSTRANDGRADPWGGFWISTMGKQAECGLGSIYRYFKGNLVKLYSGLTIPNAICFSPDKKFAYYTDTPKRIIMRQVLNRNGWPKGKSEKFIDLSKYELNPDGAVVDSAGYLWNAQWASSQVSRYSPNGELVECIKLPVKQPTCPCFGGVDFQTLYCTSASENLLKPLRLDGSVQAFVTSGKGQPEFKVIL
ncbi:SMP-30/gluconolactonase/LRE family protein [Alphaproteobacteria bacterium]|nr:SMP-30/gluconolactonase/LRE family protein [Alphaproteobacteria bacterium]